jgi:hypothetical protein
MTLGPGICLRSSARPIVSACQNSSPPRSSSSGLQLPRTGKFSTCLGWSRTQARPVLCV